MVTKVRGSVVLPGSAVTEVQEEVLSHWTYDDSSRRLVSDKAIETTLNSLYLGEQHKMSSGSENIYFTNLTSDINFFPMWGGLKDQSITANRDGSGFIPPSGRVYSDMFSLPLGGSPDPLTSVGYAGNNYFGINISGLGITTVAAEEVGTDVRLEYRITISGRQVYMQELPRSGSRSSAGSVIYPNDTIEWFFDHPVDVHAGTTLFAEIHKVRNSDDVDLGVFQVRQGDTVDPNTGLLRYQATVHNRLYEDKDLELISPYVKYKAMDFGLDSTGSTILLRDLSLGAESLLVPHAVNTLEAIANGTEIKIKIKGGAKIIVESLPVNAVSINGSFVNAVLNQAVTQLNEIFTNTSGFASDDTFVNSFTLSGNDLTLGLNDGTSYTTDITSLGVDENNFVASGSLNGSDLTLTMADATTVTIDASSLALDTNDIVESGVINGSDLELTLSNASVITIDVSSLSVDTTLYVESGALSGSDLILTMSDASTVTIDASSLSVDTDTTITGGEVSGTNILLDVSDGSTLTIDASTLGGSGSSGNPVVSGSVVGTDLVLVLDDATQITIDASNMINGSTNFSSPDWYYSYGDRANESVNNTISDSSLGIAPRAPFYFGTSLERGTEFRWNFNNNKAFVLGIWDGATHNHSGTHNSKQQVNWSTGFWRDTSGFRVGSNTTLTNTTTSSRYVPSFGAALALRFLNNGHLVLVDLSGTAEVEIAKTTNALVADSFQLQLGCDAQFIFPQFVSSESENLWEIVHDYNNVENGILNGVLDHTVIKSGISIVKGEKMLFMLDYVGNGDNFGTGYTNAATGVVTAEDQLLNHFKYQTNEAMVFTQGGANDWVMSTGADGYFFAANLDQYRNGGGSGTVQGMFSLRFNNDGKLTIYDEDAGQKVATAKSDPAEGSSVHLYMGVRGNRTYSKIPVISKQSLSQSNQPNINYVPVVADQTASVEEAGVLNFQVISSDNIVNQFVEVDAPSWLTMNQNSGVLSGTAPAFLGTSADTVVVTCKAGNAIGGTVDFTVTVSITEEAGSYTNAKSLQFNGSSTFLQGNATVMNAMDRSSNGDGNAWTLSMWFKPSSSTATQTLFNYGQGSGTSTGAITLHQTGGNHITLQYGTVHNKIVIAALSCLTVGSWNHLVVTFDGGTTGSSQSDLSDYYSRFSIAVDGALVSQAGSHSNYGYVGVLNGNDTSDNIFRVGKDNNVYNNYSDSVINQVAIWNSDETSNLAAIYNGGATQDLSLLSSAPTHYYEIENSVTTISDVSGNAHLTGYNFTSSDLVTDTP